MKCESVTAPQGRPSRHHAPHCRTPTHGHPDSKPYPSTSAQLYHQQDVHKDAENWQEGEERYLQGTRHCT